jgi:hypothetical protein
MGYIQIKFRFCLLLCYPLTDIWRALGARLSVKDVDKYIHEVCKSYIEPDTALLTHHGDSMTEISDLQGRQRVAERLAMIQLYLRFDRVVEHVSRLLTALLFDCKLDKP